MGKERMTELQTITKGLYDDLAPVLEKERREALAAVDAQEERAAAFAGCDMLAGMVTVQRVTSASPNLYFGNPPQPLPPDGAAMDRDTLMTAQGEQ